MSDPGPAKVRDRRVVLVLAALVGLILAANVVSALVPELDGLLTGAPIVVVVLVVGTLLVLVRSVGRGRRA